MTSGSRMTLTFRSSTGSRAIVKLDIGDDDVDHARETLELALGELWGDAACESDDEDEVDE